MKTHQPFVLYRLQARELQTFAAMERMLAEITREAARTNHLAGARKFWGAACPMHGWRGRSRTRRDGTARVVGALSRAWGVASSLVSWSRPRTSTLSGAPRRTRPPSLSSGEQEREGCVLYCKERAMAQALDGDAERRGVSSA